MGRGRLSLGNMYRVNERLRQSLIESNKMTMTALMVANKSFIEKNYLVSYKITQDDVRHPPAANAVQPRLQPGFEYLSLVWK